jgi:hypothetical protein
MPKLQNSEVLWLAGFFAGFAACDATFAGGVGIATWHIVTTEAIISLVVAALAFHPITSGDWRIVSREK